ncbi:Hsp70 nucleotide exchange factor fes1 [Morella rubra]|uniref:Hsp70 nucleotide exchange factor fes1 n=1 Tax=Morella rubra TaxID=262757 RepID=A0A6A1V773_9ROSI|nr:Hsp70 nucleotide exchange factor fes1 [Morella rubra]KAB1207667.1 Hsp70 nucleotide exchange factor fes1 [Morella rubra]
MVRSAASIDLFLLLLLPFLLAWPLVASVDGAHEKNSSAGSLFWSTAEDETDLLRSSQENSTESVADDHSDSDGGFSSLEGMLQWAIGHSDPAKLKETSEDIQRQSPSELKKRQMELKELMEKLKMPSDAQLMQIAIDDLNNSSLSLEDRQRALQELLILVEPIDNANDLNKLGGLAVVIQELAHPDTDVRRLAAWVLGKASQNNVVVQRQVLELGALAKLMEMVKSSSTEEATKALYAVSALIRSNSVGQKLFYAEAGDIMLQDILANRSSDIRLRRKAVFLVGDLTECQLENGDKAEVPFFSDQIFLKSVVDLMASDDLDLQEKALLAIKNLLQLRTAEPLVFKDFCGLDGALEKMRQQLQSLIADEDLKDYALDVESLRSEVELIFHRKLGKVLTSTPWLV